MDHNPGLPSEIRKHKGGWVKNTTWAVDSQFTGCREIGNLRHVGAEEKGGKKKTACHANNGADHTTGRSFGYMI